MKERIIEFLKKENKTSAQFAEEIGVQPSGISHILSGRNNPSLDFVLRMLEKYPFISVDWLLFGKGFMYKERFAGTLFDEPELNNGGEKQEKTTDNIRIEAVTQQRGVNMEDQSVDETARNELVVRKIVWFYANNTFEEFIPSKDY